MKRFISLIMAAVMLFACAVPALAEEKEVTPIIVVRGLDFPALTVDLGTENEQYCRSVAEKAMIIGYTRMLRRAIRRPEEADSPAKIARCKEMLNILLDKIDTLVF